MRQLLHLNDGVRKKTAGMRTLAGALQRSSDDGARPRAEEEAGRLAGMQVELAASRDALEEARKRMRHKDATIRALLVEQRAVHNKAAAAMAAADDSAVAAQVNAAGVREADKNWSELLARAHEEISRLQAQLFSSTADLRAKGDQLLALQEKCVQLRAGRAARGADVQRLQAENARLAEALAAARAEARTAGAGRSQAEALGSLQALQAQLSVVSADLDEQRAKNIAARDEAGALRAELQRADRDKMRAERKLLATQQELDAEKEAGAQAAADLAVARDELASIRTKLAAFAAQDEVEKSELRGEVRSLKNQLGQLHAAAKEQVFSQTASLASLQNHLEHVKAEKHAAKLTTDELHTANARLTLEVGSLKADAQNRRAASKKQHEAHMQVRCRWRGARDAGMDTKTPVARLRVCHVGFNCSMTISPEPLLVLDVLVANMLCNSCLLSCTRRCFVSWTTRAVHCRSASWQSWRHDQRSWR